MPATAFRFGSSVANLGDLDSDGRNEIAVGSPWEDYDGINDTGGVLVLSLSAEGTVTQQDSLFTAGNNGGFVARSSEYMGFGLSSADVDGDGQLELLVGSPRLNDYGSVVVAWIFPSNRTISRTSVLSRSTGGFAGVFPQKTWFGFAVAAVGTSISPSVPGGDGGRRSQIAIGAFNCRVADFVTGCVWISSIDSNGRSTGRDIMIGPGEGGMAAGSAQEFNRLGRSVAGSGDLDGDGVDDVATGAYWFGATGEESGAVFIFFLRPDNTAKNIRLLSSASGPASLRRFVFPGSRTGHGLAAGDLDGDGLTDLLVGQERGNSTASSSLEGQLLLLTAVMEAAGRVTSSSQLQWNGDTRLPASEYPTLAGFGSCVAAIGDVDGDGHEDLFVSAAGDGTSEKPEKGYVLFSESHTGSSFDRWQNISSGFGQPVGFGVACAGVGDMDSNGVPDMLVGIAGDPSSQSTGGSI